MVGAATEEIERLKTQGPSATEVQKFIAEETNSTEIALKTNAFWLSYLNRQLQNEEKMNEIPSYPPKTNDLSPDEVRAAARRYLNDQNIIKLILLPETAKVGQ